MYSDKREESECDKFHCKKITHIQDELWLPPVQLINQKNSCFLACLIQCFASCDSIRNSVGNVLNVVKSLRDVLMQGISSSLCCIPVQKVAMICQACFTIYFYVRKKYQWEVSYIVQNADNVQQD